MASKPYDASHADEAVRLLRELYANRQGRGKDVIEAELKKLNSDLYNWFEADTPPGELHPWSLFRR